MYTALLFCFLTSSHLIMVSCGGDMGPGIWSVKSINKCTDDAAFKFNITVQKSKVNRTCDGFNAEMALDDDLDDSYACRIEVCTQVDGGCKPYQVIADESFARLIKKYAESNFKNALALAGMENCDFPITKGEYEIKKYIFNPCELPPKSVYGVFEAVAYLIKDSVEIACMVATVQFAPDDECICSPEEECE